MLPKSFMKLLKKLEKEFRKIKDAKAVIAYGSAVRGDSIRKQSDIDISVFLEGDYITNNEAYQQMSEMSPNYDITPRSVGEVKGIVTDIYNEAFYNHMMNNSAVIFDDTGVMKALDGNKNIKSVARQKLNLDGEHISNMSYFLMRSRRRCYRLCKWIPQYGLIEPVLSDVYSFKSSFYGFLRDAIYVTGETLSKDDYKEIVRSKFTQLFPEFDNKSIEFDMHCSGATSGHASADAWISSCLIDFDAFSEINKMKSDEIVKQVNETRKLLEFAARCVNNKIMKQLK